MSPIKPYDDEHIREGYKALRKGDHVRFLYHLGNVRYVPPTPSASTEAKLSEPPRTYGLKFESELLREEVLRLKEYVEMQNVLRQISSDPLSPGDRSFYLAGYEHSYLEKIKDYLRKQLDDVNAKEKFKRYKYLADRTEAINNQLQRIEERQAEIIHSLDWHISVNTYPSPPSR
jgi:hypothetical protein